MRVNRKKLFEIFKKEGDICPKCSHFKTCQKPCYPVKSYLNSELSNNTWERTFTKSNGEEVTIMLAKREVRETDLMKEYGGDEDHSDKLKVFSTENETAFLSGGPDTQSKMTGLFIDRFFHKMTFEDLAVKYDLADKTVAWHLYQDAVNRIHAILEIMEKEKGTRFKLDLVREKYKATVGDLPKSHQYFLLNRLLDIDAETIARLEGGRVQPSTIRSLIIRVNDGLRTGEIRLFDAAPEKIKESKQRIEIRRDRQNKYDRKKRARA